MEADLRYEGLTRGATDETDTPENSTHGYGTLSAASLPATIGANDACQVPILRNGVEKTVGESTVKVFLSRDYDITYAYEPLRVVKRKVAIQALDASGVYGGEEPAYAWDVAGNQQDLGCDGLAAWDSRDTVFSTPPTVQLTGPEYQTLEAGTYEGVIVASGGESANYEPVYVPGSLVISPVDLGDAQRFAIEVADTRYNGSEQRQPVTVTDTMRGVALAQGTDYDVSYAGDLVNVGTVQVTVIGKGNFAGFRNSSYRIGRARISVRTESAEKRFDGTSLTAPGSVDGIMGSDAVFAVTGSQTDAGASPNTYDLSFASEQARGNYAVQDEVGTLRVLTNDISGYEMSEPDGVVYNGHEQRQPSRSRSMARRSSRDVTTRLRTQTRLTRARSP